VREPGQHQSDQVVGGPFAVGGHPPGRGAGTRL
jgi:hypothetical protein